MIVGRRRRETQQRTYSMVREVLGLIDAYGVMRQPTWDGVRVLLLVLPLMHGDLRAFPLIVDAR